MLRDDAPHKQDNKGIESTLPLNDGDRLVEKNHFIFYADTNLLVWQVNKPASHYSRLADILTSLNGEKYTVSFDDILTQDAYDKVKNGEIKKIQIVFAKPRTRVDEVSALNWGKEALDLAQGLDDGRVAITVSAAHSGNRFPKSIKNYLQSWMRSESVEVLKASVDGDKEPIDLFAECVKSEVSVTMNGHYPVPDDMFEKLAAAKDRKNAEIEAHFNTSGNVLELASDSGNSARLPGQELFPDK